jgi:hypothetical protein
MAVLQAEFLIPNNIRNGEQLMRALAGAAAAYGDRPVIRATPQCRSEWMVLYGVGNPDQDLARRRQLERGRVVHWDAGYFGRGKKNGYMRVAIDGDHPQTWLDKTPDDPSRWQTHNIALREDCDPAGHILLVGLGKKSRSYLRADNWEARKLAELQRRFPGRRIVYRPKPKHTSPVLGCETDQESPIEKLLRGCALVVCRHSNVAVDGIVAGVPFEAEDGAAMWLKDKPFTIENRLSFLHRLCWWQWKPDEAAQAWAFIRGQVK